MKQRILTLFFALIMAGTAMQAQIAINETNFPDENFRNWILAQDYGQDGVLTANEIAGITQIYVSGGNIANLKGIEYFTALENLDCEGNQLTALDVSQNTALQELRCPNNQLVSLDVSQNTALIVLYCGNNQLTSLDVSQNIALSTLFCSNNQLTSLDVSQSNTALKNLSCYNNQIKDADMDNLVNGLPTVKQGSFYVIDTQDENEGNVCTKAQVVVAMAKGWKVIDKNGGGWPYTDFEGCDLVGERIRINAENFPDENFRNWILNESYGRDGILTALEIEGITLIVPYGNITNLKGIEYFTALKDLRCYNNQLTSLDVSQNTALTRLSCYNNQLTSLDVSKNTALTRLYCYNNQLTALDVSQNTALGDLNCSNNQLTSLDVSQNTALTRLDCFSNQIKGADMDNLVNSLHTVEQGRLGRFYVIDTQDANEGNVCTKAQVAVAKAKGWTVYDYNGGNPYPEYEGSDPVVPEIDTVDEGDNVDFGSDMDEDADLNGNVIGNIFYNISSADGGYDAEEGCVVVTKPMDDGQVNSLEQDDIFGDTFKNGFTGIVFKVPEGKGKILLTAETTGSMVLKVKIGADDPIEMELEGKLKVTFPYNVSEETLVYIYGSQTAQAKGNGVTATSDDALKIYNIAFVREDTTGISKAEVDADADHNWYTLDGRKLNGEPTKAGVYIHNGRKIKK